jgi:phenylalanyl-tRNA synthetase beta chain
MPAATQDVSVIVDRHTSALQVQAALIAGAGELLESIELFDRYENLSDDESEKISLAFTLTFRAPDRTLTADEVTGYREAAVAEASKLTGAILRA